MRKTHFILMVLTLLFLMSTVHLFSQEAGGNTCVVTIFKTGGSPENQPGTAFIDNGGSKTENVAFTSFAKFIDEMKSKGWVISQLVYGQGRTNYFILIFDKKK